MRRCRPHSQMGIVEDGLAGLDAVQVSFGAIVEPVRWKVEFGSRSCSSLFQVGIVTEPQGHSAHIFGRIPRIVEQHHGSAAHHKQFQGMLAQVA